jgi:hypothetical protein
MIVVYFDSEVQTVFEELVKFLSGSRNVMRKGKMAAKMAEIRRVVELEVHIDEDDDDGDGGLDSLNKNNGALYAAQKNVSTSKEGRSLTSGAILAADLDSEEGDLAMPVLNHVSMRGIVLLRGFSHKADIIGSGLHVGL